MDNTTTAAAPAGPRSAPADADPCGFATTASPEPHAVRRRALLRQHPEIKRLFGHNRWTVVPMLVAVAMQLAIAAQLAECFEGARGPVWALIALTVVHLLGAVLSHHASMFIHEASHDLCAPTPWENKLWALIANTSLGIPAAMTFRKYHPRHHAHLGTLGVDADLPARFEATSLPRTAWMKAVWLGGLLFFWLARGYQRRTPVNRDEVLNFAVTLAVNGLILWWLGPVALGYLLVCTVVGHSYHPVAAHFIHEHYTFAPGQETNSYYGGLNAVCFNVGYHVEHHDFPWVPGGRLPQLRRDYAQHYEGLTSHPSWTAVLWAFVVDARMDWSQRIVRGHRRGGAWGQPEGVGVPVLLAGDGAPPP